MNRHFLLAATAATLLATTVAASADDDAREAALMAPGPLPFTMLDLNGDGVVSAEEHAQVHQQRMAARAQQGGGQRYKHHGRHFDRIDRDDDDALSRDELAQWRAQRHARRMAGDCPRWSE